MASKKKPPNPYRLQRVERDEQSHPARPRYAISLKEGDIADPSRYNNSFHCRSRILEPARVLGIRHDEKNPYYTKVLLACEGGTVWLGQSWLQWEGKGIY